MVRSKRFMAVNFTPDLAMLYLSPVVVEVSSVALSLLTTAKVVRSSQFEIPSRCLEGKLGCLAG